MIRFKDIGFVRIELPSNRVKYLGVVNIGPYQLSVGYGDTMYGSGPDPSHPDTGGTYEVALFCGDDTVSLDDDNTVLAWVSAEEIDDLIAAVDYLGEEKVAQLKIGQYN